MDILFSTAPCVLGRVLVATGGSGVCAILLGDDADALLRDLRQRFPEARFRETGSELAEKIAAFIARPAMGLEAPLDLRGSEFQLRVWRALQEIPAGSTETYGEVAERIGARGLAKEVGEACAANPLAVAVPCHRVVRKDGGRAGYRWGVRRKRALLELEKS
jgi:AraC family transcriptional regulator of adaptative response/methylated-DNA-[protein]-cysteine methyltransferase